MGCVHKNETERVQYHSLCSVAFGAVEAALRSIVEKADTTACCLSTVGVNAASYRTKRHSPKSDLRFPDLDIVPRAGQLVQHFPHTRSASEVLRMRQWVWKSLKLHCYYWVLLPGSCYYYKYRVVLALLPTVMLLPLYITARSRYSDRAAQSGSTVQQYTPALGTFLSMPVMNAKRLINSACLWRNGYPVLRIWTASNTPEGRVGSGSCGRMAANTVMTG
jgi:hypothetical protein